MLGLIPQGNNCNNMVELPSDTWKIIIYNLTATEKSSGYEYNTLVSLGFERNVQLQLHHIKLAFISSVSKQINSLCRKHKEQLGIPTVKVKGIAFQENFAANGFLKCMIYAHENGCSWNEYTCSSAAWHGHLDCLIYAYENGCPWNFRTCENAALNGHLECLKYAHENGCEWNEDTFTNASNNGHLECSNYAYEHGCPWSVWTYL